MLMGLVFVVGAWALVFVLPLIIGKFASESSYAHACDSDWLQVVLTGHTYEHTTERNIATFSLVKTGEIL